MNNEAEILKDIGRRFKQLRKSTGLSSEYYSYTHQCCKVTTSKLESGKHNVTVKTLAKYLAIHQMTFKEFFSFKIDEDIINLSLIHI